MGQVGARGVGQDLLDDRGHHGLVVAVSAARAASGGDPKSGKRSASGQSPASPPHDPSIPGSFLLPPSPSHSPWEEEGLGCLVGWEQEVDRPCPSSGLSHSGLSTLSAGQDEAWG